MKVVESGKDSLDDMIHYIETIEENIVLEAEKTGIQQSEVIVEETKKYSGDKWCTWHKNTTHDSKNCAVLLNNTPEELKKR